MCLCVLSVSWFHIYFNGISSSLQFNCVFYLNYFLWTFLKFCASGSERIFFCQYIIYGLIWWSKNVLNSDLFASFRLRDRWSAKRNRLLFQSLNSVNEFVYSSRSYLKTIWCIQFIGPWILLFPDMWSPWLYRRTSKHWKFWSRFCFWFRSSSVHGFHFIGVWLLFLIYLLRNLWLSSRFLVSAACVSLYLLLILYLNLRVKKILRSRMLYLLNSLLLRLFWYQDFHL